MLDTKFFYDRLTSSGALFYAGVPDSLLKDFCAYITDNAPQGRHIIAANEGAAVGLACGFHLATGDIPVVYMQNSGLGNATNPLLSLVDRKVYSVPTLLLIGWRGEPGVKDEPQHVSQGEVTIPMLDAMNIPSLVLSKEEQEAAAQLEKAFGYLKTQSAPFALVIQKETFAPYTLCNKPEELSPLSREDALEEVLTHTDQRGVIVSTTGMLSRELYELREKKGQDHSRDFLTVGSMGHASQIALGIALNKPDRMVYCFDGDGAMLMQMGGMATVGNLNPSNYLHVIFNNSAHDSVGGQPTVAGGVDIISLSRALGYRTAAVAGSVEEIRKFFEGHGNAPEGPALLEIRVKKGARKDLGRPKSTPVENKASLMEFLSQAGGK